MKLLEKEQLVFDNIQEGITDTHQLEIFTSIKLNELKDILDSLEKRGLIKLTKKYDHVYNEDYWQADII